MLLGLYFFIVIALPVALGVYVLFNGLPRSRTCPRCAGETLRLRSRSHDLTARVLRREVHRRWCPRCGWEGTAHLRPEPEPAPDPVQQRERRAPASAGSADRVDLRRVDVDGDAWRVMVECWEERGRWLARLLFVAPGGQVWLDEGSMEGDSALEVITQAFALPEKTLTGRLRRTVR
ncbi:MAG: hypothetical protein ACOCVZ_08225 [Gemmatimonadota bacterium]